MDRVDWIIKFYARLHNYNILPYWFLTPIRKLVRKSANRFIPNILKDRVYNTVKEVDVIVSLTSYPARIDNVWQVVECMLRQTYLPKKIILWLSLDQFTSLNALPESLQSRIGERFEVRFVKGDIRSHKKYYYVSIENPESLIFLVDDDIYYSSDILEKTYNQYLSKSDSIVANYGYIITFYEDGTHKPYSEWKAVRGNYEGLNSFFGSGGGTLFKPSLMFKDFWDINKARKLTPLADDIWINAMADLNRIPKYIINSGLVLDIYSKDDAPLYKTNVGDGGNDRQLHDIEQYYKDFNLFTKNK